MSREIAYAIIAGLGVGGMYAFIAIGYTVILAASGVFNLAQGSIVIGGALSMYGLAQVAGWPSLAAFALIAAGGALVGMVTHVLAVLPVFNRRGVTHLTEAALLTTFGLSLVMNTVAGILFGYDTIPVKSYVSRSPIVVLGLKISPIYLVMGGVTIAVSLLLERMLKRTNVGLLLRVTVEDSEGSQLGGVSVGKVVFFAFAFGGAIAGLAGAMLAPITFASVSSSSQLVLLGFAGMAIGGYGSFAGALVGGLVVGLISELVPVFISPSFVSLVIYGFMIVVLVVRPQGLFGSAGGFGSAALREV